MHQTQNASSFSISDYYLNKMKSSSQQATASRSTTAPSASFPTLRPADIMQSQSRAIHKTAVPEPFPNHFIPTIHHVICGRGKRSYGHCGNKNFLGIVGSRIQMYSMAYTKQEKSDIVQAIVEEIEAKGGFIRQDPNTGLYSPAEEGAGREKTSQALRDCLNTKYKSSKDIKRKNRKEKRIRQPSVGGKHPRATSMPPTSMNSSTPPMMLQTSQPLFLQVPHREEQQAFLANPAGIATNAPPRADQHPEEASIYKALFQSLNPYPPSPASATDRNSARSLPPKFVSIGVNDNNNGRFFPSHPMPYVPRQRSAPAATTMAELLPPELEPMPISSNYGMQQQQQPCDLEPLPVNAEDVDALEGVEPFQLMLF